MAETGKTLAFLLFGGVFILMFVILGRTLTVSSREEDLPECTPMDTDFIKADEKLIDRFRKALTFETVSRNVGDYNRKELLELQDYIRNTYKTIHSSPLVKHEVVANYSLLYYLQGSDQSLKPYLLMGHLDVVPVPDPSVWEVPPFSGQIKDGFIYGRGAIDNKQTVFGILEALEFHLQRGFRPTRSLYVAFGHDEEVSGFDGAAALSHVISQSTNQELAFVLDEGLAILDGGLVPGMKRPTALIGTSEKGRLTLDLRVKVKGGHSSMPLKESAIGILAQAVNRIGTSEKGYLTLRLSVKTEGGHSSMPRRESAVGILANAISRLEANPHPSMFGSGPEKGMFEHLAPYMEFPYRMLMSNLWLFSPLIAAVLSGKPESNAMVRTTTAVTEFHAGIKENVIAPEARATVNHRIHPAQNVAQIVEYDRRIIADDRVEIEVRSSMEPHPKSPYCDDCFGFQSIKSSARQVWGGRGVVVAPGLMIGNTDTRHYLNLTSNIYRFSPTYMFPGDPQRFHGVNERIAVTNLQEAVNFFYHLIANADRPRLTDRVGGGPSAGEL